MKFEEFVKDIEENKWNVHGVEVYENGDLIHSYGDTKDNIYDIYSATKSVLSIAFGIVYDRGLIDLQKSILEYLPEEKVSAMTQKQKDTFSSITIQRLLTMAVPDYPLRPEGENYLDYSLEYEIRNPENVVFNYSNIDSYLIGVACSEVLGCDLGAFIVREIFEPLDITQYELGYSPEGYFYGASKMKLSVHDLSKMGILMSNGGVYNGRRILSEEYVSLATSVQQMNQEGGYGFYFWKYRDGFSINGKWKQKCYCLPKQKLIITYLSHIEEDSHDLIESMEKNILGIENNQNYIQWIRRKVGHEKVMMVFAGGCIL